jgi:hypothetical protein
MEFISLLFYLDHLRVHMLMEVNNVIYQLLQVYMLDMYFDEKRWSYAQLFLYLYKINTTFYE